MAKISIDLANGTIKDENIIVGIDLGTTNSLIARILENKPIAIADYNKDTIVPSIIHFGKSGNITVGESAKPLLIEEPQNTIYSVKRLLGRSYKDVAHHSNFFSYKIIDDETQSLVKIQVGETFYSPIELSAFILRELKQRAEHRLKLTINQAVITVPAYFNDSQRQATRDAGKIAGLDVLRIVNEPTAAALAYGIGISPEEDKTIVVYDLGGGTFDVTILRIEDGVFEVLATNGDTYLGGDDFDRLIVEKWLLNLDLTSNHLKNEKRLSQEIRLLAEEAKKTLSKQDHFIGELQWEGESKKLELSRLDFDNLIQPLVQKSMECVKNALKDAEILPQKIDEILMVGGSTRVPLVRESVISFFNKTPLDSINPDEVVALGAAIQADILAGNRTDLLLLDVCPLSLGIETAGGLMDVLIPRNSKIPTKAGEQYTTSVDGQINMRISVFQGERELVSENRKLAEFELKNIPAMPVGMPKVEISFFIDADSILKVSAHELRSGIKQEISVKPQYGISDEDVEKMLLDSMNFAQKDMETRMLIEAKEEAKQLLYHAEKFLELNNQLLINEEVTEMKRLMNELVSILETGSKNEIHVAIENLNSYSKPFAERVMDVAIQQAMIGKKIE